MTNDLTCRKDGRRRSLRDEIGRRRETGDAEPLNGLDYLEVGDDRRTLTVYFLERAPEGIERENVLVEGGRRVRGLRVAERPRTYRARAPGLDDYMEVVVDRPGDFSTYTLRLVEAEGGRPTDRPLSGFDPRYASVEFRFDAGRHDDLDCKTETICPPPERDEPDIDYLAKDYAGFRRLILDRLALIMPDWKERHVPDLGVALVEILAYAGDHLSYYQDAVATEAYLETARKRISVRRHARLVDYHLHEGCNARAWVCVGTDTDLPLDPSDLSFVAGFEGPPEKGRTLSPEDLRSSRNHEVFEPLLEDRYFFHPDEIAAGLADKLLDPPERLSLLSRYLLIQFSWRTRRLLEEYERSQPPPEALLPVLANELNRLLEDEGLYDGRRFERIPLSDETRELAEHGAPDGGLARLNRLLLEEAYPEDIEKGNRLRFHAAHDEILFHTWGDGECCLPRGATATTLKDAWAGEPRERSGERPRRLRLREGDVVIFEEVIGPGTGNPADADPAHRHAVRLTRVTPDRDKLFDQPVVEIEWSGEDALPFPLCLSTVGPDCEPLENVSVARGNVVLVDHGETLEPEDLGTVPEAGESLRCPNECHPAETVVRPGKFRPYLEEGPLTFGQRLPAGGPAFRLLDQEPCHAVPRIPALIGTRITPGGIVDTPWTARRDLLGSGSQDRHFVVEVDDERRARLRFGDGELGRMPEAGTNFRATYRVGNGPSGNVGAETITHAVIRGTANGATLSPRNPLPARGGTPPETLAEARLFAPHAFRTDLRRAITPDDYARLAERHPKVQSAAATLRWTGSRFEMLVAIDPRADVDLHSEGTGQRILREVEDLLYPYRRIGHDLVVAWARYVPLDIEMEVCVLPGFLRGHVKAALLDLLGNRTLPDGRRGLFHPDELTFGDGIYLSRLVAAAQAVAGVESVGVTKLERLFEGPNREVERGVLPLGPLEVARLDNDPDLPENGRLLLT